jgi:hypothetical protein
MHVSPSVVGGPADGELDVGGWLRAGPPAELEDAVLGPEPTAEYRIGGVGRDARRSDDGDERGDRCGDDGDVASGSGHRSASSRVTAGSSIG